MKNRHPGWLYVDGLKPAVIAKAHDLDVEGVLDQASRIGVPDRLLRADGLGSKCKSREQLKADALAAIREAANKQKVAA